MRRPTSRAEPSRWLPTKLATVLAILRDDAEHCYAGYSQMLDLNLARELARINLTLATYTQWYWKIDLHNNRKGIGIEIDDKYIAIANNRINQYLNNTLKIRPIGKPVHKPTGREKFHKFLYPGLIMLLETNDYRGKYSFKRQTV